MPARGPMDIVILCENTLGWTSPMTEYTTLRKVRIIEARRLNQLMATNPKVTLRNLELAIELARRRSETRSPLGLVHLIDKALELAAAEAKPRTLSDEIAEAVGWEQAHQLPDSQHWIDRLTRSQAQFRIPTLAAWRATRNQET